MDDTSLAHIWIISELTAYDYLLQKYMWILEDLGAKTEYLKETQ